jgi:hypothetical protein
MIVHFYYILLKIIPLCLCTHYLSHLNSRLLMVKWSIYSGHQIMAQLDVWSLKFLISK